MGDRDQSGFTPQQRHDIIIATLKEVKKKTNVFHLRWAPGDLLDVKILKSTPIFWYIRFGWTRKDIVHLLFKARIYVDPVMMESLNKVFGADYRGPRWTPPDLQKRREAEWRKRRYKKS